MTDRERMQALKEQLFRDSARDREMFAAIRQGMGLGAKAFAKQLNVVLGPDERPLGLQSIHAWEQCLAAPGYVMDAALELLRNPPALRIPVELDGGMSVGRSGRDRGGFERDRDRDVGRSIA